MDAARFQKLRQLFETAFDLEPDARKEFLAIECGGDEELLHDVLALFKDVNNETTRSLLSLGDELVEGIAGGANSEREDERIPEHIGPYEVVRLLGEGGMGSVYLAHDTRTEGRLVALKIIRYTAPSTQIRRRFEQEREILGALRHPNIALLFDSGMSERGDPYFVLEYIDGKDIREFCDLHSYSIEARLRLFSTVCKAVHSAHQRLIVHRDLKPANILVTNTDNGPLPKIIDFGVAKTIESTTGLDAAITNAQQMIGTLGYIAPEQIRFGPRVIDSRSDVYSLGIVLYELLTGQRPLTDETIHDSSPLELATLITDLAPPRASRLVRFAPDAIPRCGHTPSQLAAELSGDLDAILRKAIATLPEDRYESAAALSNDIDRFLNHDAILARPEHIGSTILRLSKKHRTASLTFIALALLLIGATAISLTFANQARIARANSELKNAQLESQVYRTEMQLAGIAIGNRDWRTALVHLQRAPQSQRLWEWHALNELSSGGWAAFKIHPSAISAIAPRPGKPELAIGFRDGSIFLSSSETDTPVRIANMDRIIQALHWNETGDLLVIELPEDEWELLDLKSRDRQKLATFNDIALLEAATVDSSLLASGSGGLVRAFNEDFRRFTREVFRHSEPSEHLVGISGNGRFAGMTTRTGRWLSRNTANSRIAAEWVAPNESLAHSVISSRGDVAAIGVNSRVVRLGSIDMPNTDSVEICEISAGAPLLAFSPNAERLAIADPSGRLLVASVRTGLIEQEIPMPFGGLSTITWSVDSSRIIIGNNEGLIRWVGLDTSSSLRWNSGSNEVIAGTILDNPSGLILVNANGTLARQFFSVNSTNTTLSLNATLPSAAFNKERVVIGDSGGVVSVLSSELTDIESHSVAGSPIRHIALSNEPNVVFVTTLSSDVFELDLDSGAINLLIGNLRSLITSTATARAAPIIALGWHDGRVVIQDLEHRQAQIEFDTEVAMPILALSTSGTRLFVAGSNGHVASFDVESGTALWRLHEGASIARTLVFHDSGRIIVGSDDGSLTIFDSDNGAELTTIALGPAPIVSLTSNDFSGSLAIFTANGLVWSLCPNSRP